MIYLGKKNECSEGKFFDFRDHIPMITDAIAEEQPGLCFNEPSQIQAINTTKLNNVIKALPSGPSCSTTSSHDTAALDTSMYTYRHRKRQYLDNSAFDDDPWSTEKHFEADWLVKIKNHQDDLLPTSEINKNKNWFTYLYNSQDPKKSR